MTKIISTKRMPGIALAAALLTAGAAGAGDRVPLPLPDVPASRAVEPGPYVVPTPEPGGGVTVHGGAGGFKGGVTHQPLGHGFETNGGRVTTPGGMTLGGSVTTGPGGVHGGRIEFGKTY